MKRIAVVPSYKPDYKMISLLRELKENKYLIIVVNDGSSEAYNQIFEQAEKYSTVLKHDINQGKGAALKTAFNYINNKYKNYCIVTIDCDGQHKVSDANKLCEYLKNNPLDLVIGKRIRSEKTPIRSRLGNAITRLVYSLVTKIDVYDTQTGLRAFTDKLMELMLNIDGDRYEYEMNMLLVCPKNNINIKEIEIETIYFDNNAHSHFNAIKDSYKIYKQIIKFSCISFLSFIIDYSLYIMFNLVLNNILFSNILSRIISSSVNYHFNKTLVFATKNKTSFLKYYCLVVCILILNTTILEILVNQLFINEYISKLITELLLFILSFIVQKKYVFQKDKKELL